MLESVHVRGMPAGLSGRERLHALNTLISFSSEQQVCAAGALLAILCKEGLLLGGGTGERGRQRRSFQVGNCARYLHAPPLPCVHGCSFAGGLLPAGWLTPLLLVSPCP